MERYDVVVVGAGLAGLHSAFELARLRLRVALIDRQPAPGTHLSTTGIFVRKTLEDFAVPADCLGPWVDTIFFHSPAGRTLELRAHRPEFRVARMRPLYAYLLLRCILRGVTWLPQTAFVGLQRERADMQVLVRRDGRADSLPARFIIGADGAHSRVARALGLSVNRELIVGVERVVPSARACPPAFHCLLDPKLAPGYIAWVVDDGEEAHVGVGGYARRFSPPIALDELCRRWGPAMRVPPHERHSAEWRAGVIPVGGVLPRIACKDGLLVGDAAGAPSPLTAGGIDACFRLSAFAARIVHRRLTLGDQAALATYRGDRFRARFWSRRFLRGVMRALGSRGTAELAFSVLSNPLCEPLARRIFFHRGSFPDVHIGPATAIFEPFPPYGSE